MGKISDLFHYGNGCLNKELKRDIELEINYNNKFAQFKNMRKFADVGGNFLTGE